VGATPLWQDVRVEILIVVLLVVLILVIGFVGLRLAAKPAAQSVAPTVMAPAVDMAPIVEAVKAAIDVNAISTGVRGAVETQMLATAQQALAQNNEQAKQQANQTLEAQQASLDQQTKNLLQPLEERLAQLNQAVGSLHTNYTEEKTAVEALRVQLTDLQSSTTSLREALKSPTARGSWGENQLRNVVRLAGMENYCDFTEQFTGSENDRLQRPDVVINLPTGGRIAVDSKAPLNSYLRMQDAIEISVKEIELKNHAKDLRTHVKTLAEKKYWDQFGHDTPDFVVMFIPGEGFVADAMKADTLLLDDAMKQRVLVASPVNLLALLLTVAKGWQSHKLNEHAELVAKEGKDLYERMSKVLDDVVKMGKALGTATSTYDEMIGSIETRLMVTMRRLKDLGVVQENAPEKTIKPIGQVPRALRVPETTSPIAEIE
jgi:DNA recombination protein RmuC